MRAIIFFTRVPILGRCKTRLFDFLTPVGALNLQKKLIKDNYKILKSTQNQIFIFHSDDGNVSILKNITSKNAEFILQNGLNLGQKMSYAFNRIFAMGYDEVLLLGSDIVGLSKDFIDNAFNSLKTAEVVLAPSKDGGYSLIGLKRPCEELFALEYSKEDVCAKTCQKAINLALKTKLLPRLQDIDTKEDIFSYITKSELKLLASGEYNSNYVYEKNEKKRLFRVKFGSQINVVDPAFYEFSALKTLEVSGVVPRVFKLYKRSEFLPLGAMEMEFLEGRAVDYKKDLFVVAGLLAKIHNVKIPPSSTLIRTKKPFLAIYEECKTMAKVYFEYKKADSKIVKDLSFFFEEVGKLGLDDEIEDECIINTELNNTNFIINERSYIIDWEKPIIGECEQDLAHFLVPTTTFFRTDTVLSKDEIFSFLKEYEKMRKFSYEKFDKYFKFTILRGLSWCVMAKVEYENERNIGNVKDKINSYFDDKFITYLKSFFYKDSLVF